MNKEIKSSFPIGEIYPQFFAEFKSLCEKYGYNQWFFLVGQPEDEDNSEWEGEVGPFISEGILGAAIGFAEEVAKKYELEPSIPEEDYLDY